MKAKILFIICFSFSLCNFCFAQVRDTVIFYESAQETLTKALKNIKKKYNIELAYNPEALKKIVVTENYVSVKFSDFLHSVLANTEFTYKILNSTYLIYPKVQTVKKNSLELNSYNITISGSIRDRETGESLPFAAVYFFGGNSSTSSNSDGNFTLFNVATDTSTLFISYLGYNINKLKLTPVIATKPIIILMEAKSKNLPPIEIFAENTRLLDAEKGLSRISINQAKISNLPSMGEVDLLNSLQLLPGINSTDESSSGLKVRGSTSEQNLVMFDGFTVFHVDHFFGLYSAFNTSAIKNIQLYKGPFESKYGGRAAGVVAITGIDGNANKPSTTFGVNLISTNLLIELPLVKNQVSLIIAARRSFTDILQSESYKKLFNNIYNTSVSKQSDEEINSFTNGSSPDFFFYDTNIKLSIAADKKNNLAFSFYKGLDNLDIIFTESYQNNIYNSSDKSQWGNTGGSFKWSRQWNKSFFSYFIVGSSLYKSQLEAEEYKKTVDTSTTLLFFQSNRLNDFNIRLDNEFQISESNKISFGVSSNSNKIQTTLNKERAFKNDTIAKSQIKSLYIQDEFKLFKNLKLNIGYRLNYYNLTKNYFHEPRLDVVFSVLKNISLKTGYGIHNQMIRKVNEQSLYLNDPEKWELSDNSNIPVLNSKQFAFGGNIKWKKLFIDIEYFQKNQLGLIELLEPEKFTSVGNGTRLYYLNGRGITKGVDLLIQKTTGKHTGWISYTLSKSKNKYKGINSEAYFNASTNIPNEIKLVYLYEYKNWHFSSCFTYGDGRPYTPLSLLTYITPSDEIIQAYIIGDVNSKRTPNYQRLDFSIVYNFKIKKCVFESGFSVFNMLDRKNVKFIDYYEVPSEENNKLIELKERKVLQLGFTPSFFIKLKI
jgi:ferric enterobactin receptor